MLRTVVQDVDYILKVCFHSELCNVKQVTCQTINFLIDNVPLLSEEDVFDLKLVYSELLVNAVIHGNKMDKNKSVYLFVEATDNIVYSVISDEGSGFDYKKALNKIDLNANLMDETGRGIRLANALTDFLSYNRPGNQVTFYKQIGRSEDSDSIDSVKTYSLNTG